MNKKIIALLMTICMMITAFAGCGSKATNASKDKKDNEKITVTDMLGREVTIKGTPKRVIATNGALRFYCYVANLDKLVGVEQMEKKSPKGKPYMLANKSLAKLPVVGRGGASNTDDYENILKVKPDVIFIVGSDKAASDIDKLQDKTGVPVVSLTYGTVTIFDEEVYKSLKIIGKVMNEEKRAKEVVDYMEKCKKDLNDRTKDIPEDKKPTVYAGALAHYGVHGIESTLGKNALFNALNAKNVVDETGKVGSIMIDKEKLLQWNPNKIFIDLTGIQLVKEDYKKNPNFYKTLNAFKNGQVYSQLPYKYYWSNIGTAIADAYYMGKVLYPEEFKGIEPKKKADEIYKFLLGKGVYSQMAKDYGEFKKITLEDLEK